MTRTQIHRMARFNSAPRVEWHAEWPQEPRGWPIVVAVLVTCGCVLMAMWGLR